jgi:hypothetical protein
MAARRPTWNLGRAMRTHAQFGRRPRLQAQSRRRPDQRRRAATAAPPRHPPSALRQSPRTFRSAQARRPLRPARSAQNNSVPAEPHSEASLRGRRRKDAWLPAHTARGVLAVRLVEAKQKTERMLRGLAAASRSRPWLGIQPCQRLRGGAQEQGRARRRPRSSETKSSTTASSASPTAIHDRDGSQQPSGHPRPYADDEDSDDAHA